MAPDPSGQSPCDTGDLAASRLLWAAFRFDPRVALDLLSIDAHVQPLGAVAWAAAAKDPSWMPEGVIANLKRRARFQHYLLEEAGLLHQVTAADLSRALRLATVRAERLISVLPRRLPYGFLLTPDGELARPDPDRRETLQGLVVLEERHS